MKQYSPLAIDVAFDKIWEFWINKEKENAARKALQVTINSGNSPEEIIKACRIYALSHEGHEFTCQLNNFLLQDLWRDSIEDLSKLEARRLLAVKIINEWNAKCKDHWCKALDVDSRIPIALKALENKFFEKNWKISLDKAALIFQYRHREGDHRQKIILSLRWFCNVSHDKHTVLRIMEGEFGEAYNERIATYKPKKNLEINHEERKAAAEYFRRLLSGEVLKEPDLKKKSPKRGDEFILFEDRSD